jgi:biopolymer transport protein ExbD
MKLGSPVRRKHSRIEIIPLIDIMFFLLASFMMVSLQMQKVETIKVNLPTASQARPDFKPDMIALAVDQAGEVWFGKERITLVELNSVLTNRFHANTNVPVYISGDQDTRHGDMVRVLDFVRRAGIEKVAFSVNAERSSETK